MEGKVFGTAGPYEKLTGQAYGEVDPGNPLNSIIQDIRLAPGNERGMVEYISDFIILRPADMAKSNGLAFPQPSKPGRCISGRYGFAWKRICLFLVRLAGGCSKGE